MQKPIAVFACALSCLIHVPNVARADPQVAQAAYQEGAELYLHGKYRPALAAFERAYSEDRAPNLLFNIAQCQWKLGLIEEAIATYQRYLDEAPEAENRAEVEQRIAQLRADPPEPGPPVDAPPPATEPVPPPAPHHEPTPPTPAPTPASLTTAPIDEAPIGLSPLRVAAYATAGVGLAALITSVTLATVGQTKAKNASEEDVFSEDAEDTVNTLKGACYVSLGIGLAAAAGATVLYLLSGDPAGSEETPQPATMGAARGMSMKVAF